MRTLPPIHPLLFASFPIIFLYANNAQYVAFQSILVPIFISVLTTSIIYIILKLLIIDPNKSAIILSFFLIIFFSYANIYDNALWLSESVNYYIIIRHGKLIVFLVTAVGLFAFFVWKTNRELMVINTFLNIVGISLITMSIANIAVQKLVIYPKKNITKPVTRQIEGDISTKGSPKRKIDIYYIILDEYAITDTLLQQLNYDNREFNDYLLRKGFYIANQSQSNYANTFLSLASSLNMNYINFIEKIVGDREKSRALPYHLIKHGKVIRLLKSFGYKYIHVSSGWGATDLNNYADLNVNCGIAGEFAMLIINTTMTWPFKQYFIKTNVDFPCIFAKLAKISKEPGPKFVFAHILLPHGDISESEGPFVERNLEIRKQEYLERLIFVNGKVKELIDSILSQNDTPPIIILQGDHGTDFNLGNMEDPQSGWFHPTDTMFMERMRILNAYYLPSVDKKILYDSITPVNTFRMIFNAYLGTHYELLPDRSYFSSYENPYNFLDVTERMNIYKKKNEEK